MTTRRIGKMQGRISATRMGYLYVFRSRGQMGIWECGDLFLDLRGLFIRYLSVSMIFVGGGSEAKPTHHISSLHLACSCAKPIILLHWPTCQLNVVRMGITLVYSSSTNRATAGAQGGWPSRNRNWAVFFWSSYRSSRIICCKLVRGAHFCMTISAVEKSKH